MASATSLGGSDICQRSIDFTIPTGAKVDLDRICPTGRAQPVVADTIRPTGSLSFDYGDESYLDDWIAGTSRALVFTISGAANGIETPRLLLQSKSRRFPNGLANNSDNVGRYLHGHVIAQTVDAQAGAVNLDGVALDPSMFQTVGDGFYSCAKLSIGTGSHTMNAAHPFGIYVYGFGSFDSYGYPGGLALEVITGP